MFAQFFNMTCLLVFLIYQNSESNPEVITDNK